MGEGVSEEDSSLSFQSVKELFYSCLPYYLSIGMSAAEFWDEEPELAVAYREADELKRENMNLSAWLNGLYTYRALLSASPVFHDFIKGKVEPLPYDEPIPITERMREKKEQDEIKKAQDELKAYVEGFASKFNAKMEVKDGS